MARLLLDLRLALRRVGQNPVFPAVAVLPLALGIGANPALFSAINAILLRPLPVAESSRLVTLNARMGGNTFPSFSYLNYRDLRDRNTVLSGLAAYDIVPVSLGLPGASQRVWGYMATANYFDVLGLSAIAGRPFNPHHNLNPPRHPPLLLIYP